MFELEEFVADLRASLADRSRQALKEVVERAVSEPASVVRAIGEPNAHGMWILHQAADLTILNVIWGPNQVTLPHDHRMTAVIGIYGGREDNLFWRRATKTARFDIEAAGGKALGTGDVTLLGQDVIHSVINPLGRFTGALHVYDGPFLTAARSMWNPETLVEEPYDITAVTKGMPVGVVR